MTDHEMKLMMLDLDGILTKAYVERANGTGEDNGDDDNQGGDDNGSLEG